MIIQYVIFPQIFWFIFIPTQLLLCDPSDFIRNFPDFDGVNQNIYVFGLAQLKKHYVSL